MVLMPLMGWNRAAVAGSVLPWKQLIYNLAFLYSLYRFPYLSYLLLGPSYRKVVPAFAVL